MAMTRRLREAAQGPGEVFSALPAEPEFRSSAVLTVPADLPEVARREQLDDGGQIGEDGRPDVIRVGRCDVEPALPALVDEGAEPCMIATKSRLRSLLTSHRLHQPACPILEG